jgi:hypothetical protein
MTVADLVRELGLEHVNVLHQCGDRPVLSARTRYGLELVAHWDDDTSRWQLHLRGVASWYHRN